MGELTEAVEARKHGETRITFGWVAIAIAALVMLTCKAATGIVTAARR